MNKGNDIVIDGDDLSGEGKDTTELNDEFKSFQIRKEEQRFNHQKYLFNGVIVVSGIIVIFVGLIANNFVKNDLTTQEALLLGMMITAPIILILALMRYVYDGKKEDNPQPTLMLNVGKELAGVITSIIKK